MSHNVTGRKRSYNQAQLSSCCKNLLGELLFAAGEHRAVVQQVMSKAGLHVPERTQRRWINQTQAVGFAVHTASSSGRPTLLSPDHKKLVLGFIANAIDSNNPVNNKEVQDFICNKLGVSVSHNTVCRLTKELGFSSQRPRLRTAGYPLLIKDLAPLYLDFITETAHPMFAKLERSQIASIDFTYTTHHHDTQKKLGYTGG